MFKGILPMVLNVAFSVLLSLLLGSTLAIANNDSEKQRQLEQLEKEMQELKGLLSNFKSQRSKLQSSLQKSEVNIGQLQKKIRSIKQQLLTEQRELRALQQQRGELESAKKSQTKYIEQQILAAYQVGQQKKLKILLNQEQPEKLSRALTYYDYFNQARSEQIESYVDIISELDQLEPKIFRKTHSLTEAKNSLSMEHRNLLRRKEEREKNLLTINSEIKNKDQRLRKIAKDRSELERLVEAVEQTLANISIPKDYRAFTSLKGKLPWPVAGKPSNRFGSRRSDSSLRWQGLNIPANEGKQVNAIHHGRVVFADWLRGSGLLIIIDHGNGYMSLYGHNQSLLKEPGEWVAGGETIATIGNSGGQSRAGLYFEIRHNGKPTDPGKWCRRT